MVAKYLSHARNPSGWHRMGEVGNIHWAAISTHIVLSGTELSFLRGDFFQIFLRWRIGIANLQMEALIANGLPMQRSDSLISDFKALETR